ncbi:hypothetical protein VPH35_006399 [Triticum aestivum]
MHVMCVLWSFTYELDLHNMSLLLALELLLLLLALPRLSCRSTSNSTHPSLDRQADALLRWKAGLYIREIYHLDSWTKGTSPCDYWTGVTCSNAVLPRGGDQGDAALVVSNISLVKFGLEGRLDRLHFEDLPHLVHLDFFYNNLRGPIPSSKGTVTKLEYLDLSRNYLHGFIPKSLDLPLLVHLDLNYNNLLGLIPSSIGTLVMLEYLDLSSNDLNGSIMHSIDLPHLVHLYVNHNNLSGPIPSSIGTLVKLKYLDISDNHLHGSIPHPIGNCTKLSSIYLFYYNFLCHASYSRNTREFNEPLHFADLPHLVHLNLGNNHLSGGIPSSIGALAKLENLDLSGNDMNGYIPTSLDLPHLNNLNLDNNLLSGGIPSSIGALAKLEYLDLSSNNLNGSIPTSLRNFTKLTSIDLF